MRVAALHPSRARLRGPSHRLPPHRPLSSISRSPRLPHHHPSLASAHYRMRMTAMATHATNRQAAFSTAPSSSSDAPASPPPEVASITEDEFHATRLGGSSHLAFGEFGENGAEMQTFWFRMGMPLGTCTRLALRADRIGGVWGDPEVLRARCEALSVLLPLRPLSHLITTFPDILVYRPLTLREKLHLLSDALPHVDVLRMASNSPSVLARDPDKLRMRTREFISLLPRKDMPYILADHPKLLRLEPSVMRERFDAILRTFSTASLSTMKGDRLAHLFAYEAFELLRLHLLDKYYPGLRDRNLNDFRILRMKEAKFRAIFTRTKPSRRRVE